MTLESSNNSIHHCLGSSLKHECYSCPFNVDEIEKDCALNATLAVVKECRRGNACVVQTGNSITEDGTKRVEYRKCGRMEENLDADDCKDETLDSLAVKTCFCKGELCNGPSPSKYIFCFGNLCTSYYAG